MGVIKVRIQCQKCGSYNHDPHYEADNFYVCSDCGNVIGYDCPGCEKFFTYNHLGFLDGKYVCKDCGRIQWGYTEWKNKKGESG